ncbi:MAG: glutathione S-transferase N-terminal domain-containing protein, partial [Steroidobacteraceae bacterium]
MGKFGFELYFARSPVAFKVLIAMEEMGLAYHGIELDVSQGQQYDPAYTRLNPNNKIPCLVDHAPSDGGAALPVFESGAILLYLAEKTGTFLPREARARIAVIQWVFWQMAGLGPTMGQARHFRFFARERIPYAIERFTNEATRQYGVLDRQLTDREYLCGEYSIADMACWTWLLYSKSNGQDLDAHPHLARWFRAVEVRPAVQRVAERYWQGL